MGKVKKRKVSPLKQTSKAVKNMEEEYMLNNAMSVYACASDSTLEYDHNLFSNRSYPLPLAEEIDFACLISEMLCRGMSV